MAFEINYMDNVLSWTSVPDTNEYVVKLTQGGGPELTIYDGPNTSTPLDISDMLSPVEVIVKRKKPSGEETLGKKKLK